jgi:hypothetical protein
MFDVRDKGGVLRLADGRIVFATEFSGRSGMVAGRPGERVFPFVETSAYPPEARFPVSGLRSSGISTGALLSAECLHLSFSMCALKDLGIGAANDANYVN